MAPGWVSWSRSRTSSQACTEALFSLAISILAAEMQATFMRAPSTIFGFESWPTGSDRRYWQTPNPPAVQPGIPARCEQFFIRHAFQQRQNFRVRGIVLRPNFLQRGIAILLVDA